MAKRVDSFSMVEMKESDGQEVVVNREGDTKV